MHKDACVQDNIWNKQVSGVPSRKGNWSLLVQLLHLSLTFRPQNWTVAKCAMAYGLPCQNNEWPLNNTLGYECQSNPANIATNVFGKYLNDLVLAHPQSGSFTIPKSSVELEFGNLGFGEGKTQRKKLPVFA